MLQPVEVEVVDEVVLDMMVLDIESEQFEL